MNKEQINVQKVRQSNQLVESPYSQEFTAHEIKLFELAVAGCKSEDEILIKKENNKKFKFTTKELANALNTSSSVISHEIEKTVVRIMKKTIHQRKILDDGTVEFQLINIIPFAQYKDGIFVFHLNYLVLPHLIEINSNFTEYQLKHLLSMSSAYAIKLYKLLYQYKKIKYRVFTVDELKEQFGVSSKYNKYNNFKKDVILSSIKQINELTDLRVEYKEIKFGRKIEKLEFIFEVKTFKSQDLQPNEIIDISNHDVESNLPITLENELSTQTKALISQYQQNKGIEYVEASIAYAKKHAKSNLDKYLYDTLTNGWAEVDLKKLKSKKQIEESQKSEKIIKKVKKSEEQKINKVNQDEIQKLFGDLDSIQQHRYKEVASHILSKFSFELANYKENELSYSIFAISINRSYNRLMEGYITQVLHQSLDIANVLELAILPC